MEFTVVLDDVERLAQLAVVPDDGHLPEVMAIRLQELHQQLLVREAEQIARPANP